MPTDILALPVAERDRLAAEKILGWHLELGAAYLPNGKLAAIASSFECRRPEIDYLILQKVRGEWAVKDRVAFGVALNDEILTPDGGIDSFEILNYKPGNFRDAALLVLAEKGEI